MEPSPPTPARHTPGTEPARGEAFVVVGAPDGFLSPAQRPGELGRLGPYRVLAELGRGGMGAVYRAEDPRLGRELALKVLLPELAADPRAAARFLREARALARVEHDHIVAVHEVGEANGVPFLAMPLLKGESLAAALLRTPRQPLAEALRVACEIATGLAAAHAVGIVHRDIKPGNIWLEGPKRRVKILDFGLAREAPPALGAPADPLTAAGAVLGTPAYMSPEQARGRPLDGRSDLFSLGAVLYQMVAGRPPFTGASAFEVMTAVATSEPPAPEAPPAVADLICRLLAKNPARRPASAQSVADQLEGFGHEPTLVQGVNAVVVAGDPSHGSVPWLSIGPSSDEPSRTEAVAEEPAKPTAPPAHRRFGPWRSAALALAALLAFGLALGFALKKPKGTGDETPSAPVVPVVPTVGVAPMPREAPPFFNGKDLTGWDGAPGVWQVRDGALVGTLARDQKGTFLCSARTYTDFELVFKVKMPHAKGNSGVQVRSRLIPGAPFQVAGPQCDIGPGHWGALYDQTNALFIRKAPSEIEKGIQADRYHEYAIRCVGRRVTIKIDGKVSIDDEFVLADEGIIAWQVNALTGVRTTSVEVAFAQIRFTDLRK